MSKQFERYPAQERLFSWLQVGDLVVAQAVVTTLRVAALKGSPVENSARVREAAHCDDLVLGYGKPIRGTVREPAITESDSLVLLSGGNIRPVPVTVVPVETNPPELGPLAATYIFFDPDGHP